MTRYAPASSCPECRRRFEVARAGQKYCSDSCRVSFNRRESSYRNDYNQIISLISRLAKNTRHRDEVVAMLNELPAHISDAKLRLGSRDEMLRLDMINQLKRKQ